jgi:signal transduction histidine kinase
MIGAIAHQWSQPLNVLAINIQNLYDDAEDGKIDEKYAVKFIENNMNVIDFMSKTIDDFRNFFKIDKTKSDFSVRKSVEDMLKIQSAQLKNHFIDVSIKGDDFVVNGYESEFKQVILNIINNAKDAILENKLENGKIEIEIDDKNRKISIKDNASGIPEDVIDRIFEPYFTTKEQGKGTGIGLYMSKMIVEKNMGGKIWVTNEDNGAKFTIEF